MTRRILPILKVKWYIKHSITQAVYSILFICPFICDFKYEGIYKSRSLSRYCS